MGDFPGRLFTDWWESEEEWFCLTEPFSEPETAFCKHWTSIKIKISMTCVYKEYEVKIEIVKFLLGYNMKIVL